MKRYPLVIVTAAFIFGILLDELNNTSLNLLILSGIAIILITTFLSYRYKNIKNVAPIVVIVITGLTYHHFRGNLYSKNNLVNFVSEEKSLAKVRGIIVNQPIEKPAFNLWSSKISQVDNKEHKKYIFLLQVSSMWLKGKWQRMSGTMRVSIYFNDAIDLSKNSGSRKFVIQTLRYGNEIELVGNVVAPRPPTNPGQFDYQKYLTRQEPSIKTLMSVTSIGNVKLLSQDYGNPVFRFTYSIKNRLKDTINALGMDKEPNLINSLLLGDRESVPNHVMDNFIKTGTVQFLAISGLHVGILVISIHFVFTVLGVNRKLSAIIIIVFVIQYAVLTGMKPPVFRAAVMVVVYYGSILLNRRWNAPSGIAAAALVILIKNPASIFNVSFQLSFVALISIIYLSNRIEQFLLGQPRLEDTLVPKSRWNPLPLFKTYCIKTISVSLAAWLSVVPLVAYYFHIVSIISIPLNIIIFPLIWIILVFGFVSIILGNIFSTIAVPFAWIALKSDYLIVKIISFFAIDNISFFYTSGPTAVWIVIYYITGIIVTNGKRFGIKKFFLITIVLIISSVYIYLNTFDLKKYQLRFRCLDVGHGSAIFFEFPNGKNLLFDIGSFVNYDIGKNIVAQFLWKSRIKTVDTVIISHQHKDHWSGLPAIIERFKIKTIFTNKRFADSDIGKKLLEIAQKKKVATSQIGTGDEIEGFGKARITVLNPPKYNYTISKLSINDTSCVLKINYLGYSILLCADIEEDGINMLLNNCNLDLKADIIIVPHHGGYIANSAKFIDQVKPSFAVFSTDPSFPSNETIDLYSKTSRIFRTDQVGAIIGIIDINGIKISGFLE